MWGFESKRARKFVRASPRTLPWNFIAILSAPPNEGVLSNPPLIWPPKRFDRTPMKGFSEPETGFYRTFRIEAPPLFRLSLSNLGEGKWGRTKYTRVPGSEGDWKGRVRTEQIHRWRHRLPDLSDDDGRERGVSAVEVQENLDKFKDKTMEKVREVNNALFALEREVQLFERAVMTPECSLPPPKKNLLKQGIWTSLFQGSLPSCSPHSTGYTRTFLHPVLALGACPPVL